MHWSKEFKKELLNFNDESYGNAIKIKNKAMPCYFYRYRKFSSEYIESEIIGNIYLSRPKDFNDTNDNIVHTIDVSKFNSRQIELLEKNNFSQEFKEYDQDYTNKINDSLKLARIACFTDQFSNKHMWENYADSGKGICLEYSRNNINDIYLNCIFPVIYLDKLSNPFEDYYIIFQKKVTINQLVYYMIRKTNSWKKEREWRFVFHPLQDKKDDENYNSKGMSIKFSKPTKIILGYNMEQDSEERMIELGKKHKIKVEKSKLVNNKIHIK